MKTVHSDGSVYDDSDIDLVRCEVRAKAAEACTAIRQIDMSDICLPDVDLQEEICILESLCIDLESSKK